jgi:hypothetical protein
MLVIWDICVRLEERVFAGGDEREEVLTLEEEGACYQQAGARVYMTDAVAPGTAFSSDQCPELQLGLNIDQSPGHRILLEAAGAEEEELLPFPILRRGFHFVTASNRVSECPVCQP